MIDRGNHGDGQAATENVGSLGVVLRGIFLACSWTWCIGMFFPIYMIQDFGMWGWVAFAVPNVLGAGAMGTVLRSSRQSEQMVRRHTAAMRWFSMITILFHIYFLTACMDLSVQFGVGPPLAVVALCGGLVLVAVTKPMKWWQGAAVVYAASVACVVLAWATRPHTLMWLSTPADHTLSELAMAVPVLVFGFALCPYLDLTFHRVRRETGGRSGSWAFWIGFVVFFTPMIVLTAFYRILITEWIVTHIVVQSAFTIGAHTRELLDVGVLQRPALVERRSDRRLAGAAALLIGVVALTISAGIWANLGFFVRGDTGSKARLGYELFMSFYALVFPAYVWIVVIERGLPRVARLTLYVIALTLAAPCLWLGYIEQHYVWLLPGVAIPIVLPYLGKALTARSARR